MSECVAGVDGCESGWLAAMYNLEDGLFTFTVHSTFRELLASTENATSIAIDIPIGLTETCEPRQCDQLARRLIGPRRSSVFTAPDRRILAIQTYQEALVWSRSNTASGKGIAQQAFAIYRKILEVDRIMTPKLQDRVMKVILSSVSGNLLGNGRLNIRSDGRRDSGSGTKCSRELFQMRKSPIALRLGDSPPAWGLMMFWKRWRRRGRLLVLPVV